MLELRSWHAEITTFVFMMLFSVYSVAADLCSVLTACDSNKKKIRLDVALV